MIITLILFNKPAKGHKQFKYVKHAGYAKESSSTTESLHGNGNLCTHLHSKN